MIVLIHISVQIILHTIKLHLEFLYMNYMYASQAAVAHHMHFNA
jgi:hypothetical protein